MEYFRRKEKKSQFHNLIDLLSLLVDPLGYIESKKLIFLFPTFSNIDRRSFKYCAIKKREIFLNKNTRISIFSQLLHKMLLFVNCHGKENEKLKKITKIAEYPFDHIFM